MTLIDLLGKKWMMRILWELSQDPCSFRNLQQKCDNMSPTVLNHRMKELISVNLATKVVPGGYCLTDIGFELIELFHPLNSWVKKWEKTIPSKTGK